MRKNVINSEDQLSLLNCDFKDSVLSKEQHKVTEEAVSDNKSINTKTIIDEVSEEKDFKEEVFNEETANIDNVKEIKKLAILVDGSSFIYRAFYALPQLTDQNGNPVGAVYGFCSMLISLLSKHNSDLFCVALDAGRDTFRKDIYTQYKENRDDTPENLKAQFPVLIEACSSFGIPLIEMTGYEADDIIATLATKLSNLNYEVRIIASDKDLMQLITDDIYLFDPIKSKIIKEPEVIEKYSVKPNQMIALQALMGDSTDNIPGLPGVGPKTAAKLLNQFHSLEEIYENIEIVTPIKLQEKLKNQRDLVEISKKLVTLCKTVPIEKKLSELKVDIDTNRTKEFLSKYNFNSLIKRLDKQLAPIEKKQRQYVNFSSINDLKNFFELNNIKKFSIISTTCFNQSHIFVICTEFHIISCFFVFDNPKSNSFTGQTILSYQDICNALAPYLEDSSIQKIGLRNTVKLFPNIKSFDDISSMAYLLYGVIGNKISDLFPENESPICKISFSEICNIDQCCALAELIFDEFELIKTQLTNNNLLDVYKKIDLPLIPILNTMENHGILVSEEKLTSFATELKSEIQSIETELFALAGHSFNPASGKQVAVLLFEELKIPRPSKKNSLDIEVLEKLYEYGDIPKLIVKWRKLSKLLSTYTYSLCKLLNPVTNRLHTKFNLTATSTGRLSSSNPNLQNIPHKTTEGKKIRSAFISPEGYKLVSFDYSQIELRVLAHMADIKFLKQAFLNNLDIHKATASQIFNVDIEQISPEMRSKAKTINFGIIYGMSHTRLAKTLNISEKEAKSYIKSYFERFPEYSEFHEKVLTFAKNNGFVETITGRRCYSNNINSSNPILKTLNERQAFNAVIQGTAADIVKIAMIKAFAQQDKFQASMIVQIHDELVFETPDEFVDQLIPTMKQIMENAYELSVPLIVESKFDDCLK